MTGWNNGCCQRLQQGRQANSVSDMQTPAQLKRPIGARMFGDESFQRVGNRGGEGGKRFLIQTETLAACICQRTGWVAMPELSRVPRKFEHWELNDTMKISEIESKVQAVIMKQFSDPAEQVAQDTLLEEGLGADSMALVELMVNLEEAFDMHMPDLTNPDVRTVRTVGDVVQVIAEASSATDKAT